MVACAKYLGREIETCTRGAENCVCVAQETELSQELPMTYDILLGRWKLKHDLRLRMGITVYRIIPPMKPTDSPEPSCDRPPFGLRCVRPANHPGPCTDGYFTAMGDQL